MAGLQSVENGRKHIAISDRPAVKRMKEIMEQVLESRFEEVVQAQIDAAIGVTSEKHDRKTGDLYYVEEGPNTAAAKLLMEQVLPKEMKIQHSGGIGIVHLIKSLEDDNEHGSE